MNFMEMQKEKRNVLEETTTFLLYIFFKLYIVRLKFIFFILTFRINKYITLVLSHFFCMHISFYLYSYYFKQC